MPRSSRCRLHRRDAAQTPVRAGNADADCDTKLFDRIDDGSSSIVALAIMFSIFDAASVETSMLLLTDEPSNELAMGIGSNLSQSPGVPSLFMLISLVTRMNLSLTTSFTCSFDTLPMRFQTLSPATLYADARQFRAQFSKLMSLVSTNLKTSSKVLSSRKHTNKP